eukprot:3627364-Pyramimonas_sp.AAC.1
MQRRASLRYRRNAPSPFWLNRRGLEGPALPCASTFRRPFPRARWSRAAGSRSRGCRELSSIAEALRS